MMHGRKALFVFMFFGTLVASPPSLGAPVTTPLPVHSLWDGHWKGSDGCRFKFTLLIEARMGTKCDASFFWTLESVPAGSPFLSRIGDVGVERLAGSYSETSRVLRLRGNSVSDPTLLGLDEYRLSVARDGLSISGRSLGRGIPWTSTLSARRLRGDRVPGSFQGRWTGTHQQSSNGVYWSYPMVMDVQSVDAAKRTFRGECHWPTLRDSVTRVRGSSKGERVTFTETELLQGSDIVLHGTYVAVVSGRRMVGKWLSPENKEGGWFVLSRKEG